MKWERLLEFQLKRLEIDGDQFVIAELSSVGGEVQVCEQVVRTISYPYLYVEKQENNH